MLVDAFWYTKMVFDSVDNTFFPKGMELIGVGGLDIVAGFEDAIEKEGKGVIIYTLTQEDKIADLKNAGLIYLGNSIIALNTNKASMKTLVDKSEEHLLDKLPLDKPKLGIK